MNIEITEKSIAVECYVVDGDPTCAISYENGRVCKFYRTEFFGQKETCLFAPAGALLDRHPNSKGEIGLGYLIPGIFCLIWSNGE